MTESCHPSSWTLTFFTYCPPGTSYIFWEPVDPFVADPVRQDNDKRNNITNIYGSSLLKYTEGGDKTSQYSYLVVILSNWVPDNWVYRFPNIKAKK